MTDLFAFLGAMALMFLVIYLLGSIYNWWRNG